MRNSFRWRLAATYLLIITSVLLISGLILSLTFKEYYFSNIESNLIYEARLVAEMTGFYDESEELVPFMQNICKLAARETDTRITIIDKNGKVLGDSSFDSNELELHKNRPEVFQALQGETGIVSRYSTTAGVNMLYIAVEAGNNDFSGVVRLSMPIDELEANYRHLQYIIMLAILFTGVLAMGISFKLADRFSMPIRSITETVKEMARGNLKKRAYYNSDDELGILTAAVNSMAEYLDNSINEISEVKTRLETVLDNTVNGILMLDIEGRLSYANPMALSLLSIDLNFAGKKHVELINNYQIIELIDEVKEKGEAVRKQVVLHTLGEKVVEVNAVLIDNKETNSREGVLLVLNDITETKRLEQVRKDFVANVSHELKTPVASITGFAETLLSEVGDCSENVQEFSKIIYDESQRLKRIINGLLELSRLESGHFAIKKEEINIAVLIKNVIDTVKNTANSNKVLIDFDSPAEEVFINADADLIFQVLLNLLDNAIKYSPEDKTVRVYLQGDEKELRVSVADQGDGIPEKEVKRIFERFYRVDKARSRKTGGTGLGLAIVKHLVENHGGQVGVENLNGEGTRFYFTLPKS
jgi:two-component system phosphate regulon sensor histidine kinase PhoR